MVSFLFLLFYDLFERIVAHKVHIDLYAILVDRDLVYVLIDDHSAICQSAILKLLFRSTEKLSDLLFRKLLL